MPNDNLRRYLRMILPLSPLLSCGVIFAVAFTRIPLGVPGKWEWIRVESPTFAPLPVLLAFGAFLVAAIVAWHIDTRLWRRRIRNGLYIIVLAGFVADCAILSAGRAGIAENAVAFLNRFATGYLEEAVTAAPGELTGKFIQRTLTVPPGEAPHHRHVHPPGNVLLAALAYRTAAIPIGTTLLPGTAAELEALAHEQILMPPMDRPEVRSAALNLTVLFLVGLLATKWLLISSLPLLRVRKFGIAALFCVFGSGAAILFLGHYDSFYVAVTALALFCFLSGWRSNRLIYFGLTGIVLGCGATFTLAYGGLILLAAILLFCRPKRWRELAAFAAGGFAVIAAAAAYELNLPSAAWRCWENHRNFHSGLEMNWWPWVGFNALDAVIFAGSFTSLAVFGAFFAPRYAWRLTGAALLWPFLFFSGAARGEFGRLLCMFVPVLLLAGGVALGKILRLNPWGRVYRFAMVMCMLGLAQTVVLRIMLKLVLID